MLTLLQSKIQIHVSADECQNVNQIFNISLIFIAPMQERGEKTAKEMERVHAVGDGTDVRRMKEDVPHPSENCKGIKRIRSVSEDRVSGQRKTDRAREDEGDKKKHAIKESRQSWLQRREDRADFG